jgi:hypothetical protein
MECGIRVYMNSRDVTGWVTRVELDQARRTLYRQWTFTFAAWSNLEDGARWDLFASYDPSSTPKAEILSRAGIIPPDRARRLQVNHASVPTLTVRGYDYVWMAQRRAPEHTLVMVPGSNHRFDDSTGTIVTRDGSATLALNNYGGVVGRYQVIEGCDTLHAAIRKLANAAGANVRLLFPDYDLQPFVIDPGKSYWQAILDLIRPWKTRVYYRDSTNTLIIVDPVSSHYSIGRTLELSANVIESLSGRPVDLRRTRRLIVKVPPCR